MQYDGQHVFNEDQLNISRTVTLEGSNTTFYLEVEFVESESDVDARAFWDSTVDQGYDISGDALPDGQEFGANVATRKTPDWQVITPISTTGFTRDQIASLSSNKIPLVALATDGANKVTGAANTNLSTEKAVSTMVRYISTTQIVVREPWLFQAGEAINITDETGTSVSSITTVNYETGLLTIAAITPRVAGAIVQVTASSSPNFIVDTVPGRYRRLEVDTVAPDHVVDWRDMFFQGDEVHGDILGRGHASITDRDDRNLQSLKDYVDFLSAQIQEMKWGVPNPYTSGTDDSRVPPGLTVALPATPRYFDRSGGISGARMAAVTVGDGVSSFGDISGNTEVAIQKALDALPAIGGRIFIKRGTYSLGANVDWTNVGDVVIEGESGTVIELSGGSIHIATAGSVAIKGITIQEDTSNVALLVDTANPAEFVMIDVTIINATFSLNAILPTSSAFVRVYFTSTSVNMASTPLIKITGASGKLSGTFSQCNLFHTSAVGLTASIIDLVTGAPTQSCSNLNFVDCEFSSWLLNGTDIHLGITMSIVSFDRCLFTNILTLCHVQATGGSNLKMVNCVGGDAFAALVQLAGVSYVSIDGYLNPNSVPQAAAVFTDCNHVTVRNCDVKVNWGASLAVGAFRFATSGQVLLKNFSVLNNIVRGDATGGINKTVGVLLDLGAGFTNMIDGIKICGNTFDTCEVGAYFANTGAAGYYRNVTITGNDLYDYNAFLGNANTFKVGLLFGSSSTKINVTVANNAFSDMNPGTVDTVGGLSRMALAIMGGNNSQFSITGNTIYKVGRPSGGFELPDTAGILIGTLSDSTITGNVISGVYGAGAFGIKADLIQNSTIGDNTITGIYTSVGGSGINLTAHGIYSISALSVSFGNNSFKNIQSDAAAISAAIGSADNSSGIWQDVSATGNSFESNHALTSMFNLRVLSARRSSFCSNTLTGTSYVFFSFSGGTGGVLESVVVSSNSAQGMTSKGIIFDCNLSASARNVTINNNTVYGSGRSVDIADLQFCTINGNTLTTTTDAANIFAEKFLRFVIGNNSLSKPSGGSVDQIYVGTLGNYYQIIGNIVDQGGGSSATAIDTASASQTGDGSVSNNMHEGPLNVGTDNLDANHQY